MNKGQSGFSLIELLVATAIIAIVIMMSSDLFTIVIAQSGQQTKAVGSELESIIGLRVLRYDIEHAGYGLPGQFQNAINYSEAASTPQSTYNDSPSSAPRGIITGNNTGLNNSDYLVTKSTVAGTNDAAQKWTYILQGSAPKAWGSNKLDLAAGDRIIVIKPRVNESERNELVMNGSNYYTQFNTTLPAGFAPTQTAERFVIYGVDRNTNLRMPFNRADYYISRLPASNLPPSCAPNTGILYKATVNHSDGSLNAMPIMDCVADMQVIFRRDTNGDGVADTLTNDLSALSAQQIAENVKEARVYILAQEGQMDKTYTHSPATVTVGEFGLGSTFNLASTIGTGWQHYRWKVYTLVVTLKQPQQ